MHARRHARAHLADVSMENSHNTGGGARLVGVFFQDNQESWPFADFPQTPQTGSIMIYLVAQKVSRSLRDNKLVRGAHFFNGKYAK